MAEPIELDQAAYDRITGGGVWPLPEGTYRIRGALVLRSDADIERERAELIEFVRKARGDG